MAVVSFESEGRISVLWFSPLSDTWRSGQGYLRKAFTRTPSPSPIKRLWNGCIWNRTTDTHELEMGGGGVGVVWLSLDRNSFRSCSTLSVNQVCLGRVASPEGLVGKAFVIVYSQA